MLKRFSLIFFGAITAALAALVLSAVEGCSPQPTPSPAPSRTQTSIAPTATMIFPTRTEAPPTATSTRVLATIAPTPTPARSSNEPPPISITQILAPEPNLVTATYTVRGTRTQVELNVSPSVASIAQTALIYERACENPGIPRYALPNVVNGKSVTLVDAPFTVLLGGVLILDIKKTTQPGDASLACAVIPEVWLIELKEGSQPGTVVAFGQAGGTEVDAFIKPGPPGVAQPAFLRDGKCNDLGGIRYSLNPIVDGVSKTFFGTRFGEFKRERGALNAHKSVRELDVAVACGVLVPPE